MTTRGTGQGPPLAKGLERALARIGLPPPAGLERLSGGANMESWRLTSGGQGFVLRRVPSPAMLAGRALSLEDEARLIGAARAAGVPAPEVVAVLEPGDDIGAGFVMRQIAGSADPAILLAGADPRPLLAEIAAALAAVHRTDPSAAATLPVMDTASSLDDLSARLRAYGGDRPILALAERWLRAHLPPPVPPRLVHGDFRLGNLMARDGRLSGVLDWELAHLGDPVEDLAYACMTVWRFSRPDRPALGLGSMDDWIAAYRAAGGPAVDPSRIRFWLVYRTFWWAVSCLGMGVTWRSGAHRSLERVVIARRCAEQELDLLLLLEDEAPAAERDRPPAPSSGIPPGGLPAPAAPTAGETEPPAPVGEPTAGELLEAVSEWLAADIKPLLGGRQRFDLAVARNALGIVARELAQRPRATDAALAADLLAGRADLSTPGLLARLRRMALDKLAADMPKYPALAIARARWERT